MEGRFVKTLLAGVLSDSAVISSVFIFFVSRKPANGVPARTETKFGERETDEFGKRSNRGGTGWFGLAGRLFRAGASPWDIALV